MQLKKIAIVFLVVIMMFSLAAIGIAAEEATSELSLSAKFESDGALANEPLYVRSGDVIKLIVSVDSNPGNLRGVEVFVTYDDDVLTYQPDATTFGDVFNTELEGIILTEIERPSAEFIGYRRIQLWVDMQKSANYSNNTGVFVTLAFKVNESFDGNIDSNIIFFDTVECAIGEDYAPYSDLATPAVHAHHYGEGTSVAGDCTNSAATVYECTKEGCTEKLSVPNGVYGDHVWGELNPAIAPTVDKDGVVAHRKCTVCGACCDENGKLLSSIVDANRPEANNTVVTIIIVIVAVIVVVAGAVVALRVLKKKKIL